MEEGEGEGLECVVVIIEDSNNDKKKQGVPDAPPIVGPMPPGDLIQVEETPKLE